MEIIAGIILAVLGLTLLLVLGVGMLVFIFTASVLSILALIVFLVFEGETLLPGYSTTSDFIECVRESQTDSELQACAKEYLVDGNGQIDPLMPELIRSWGERESFSFSGMNISMKTSGQISIKQTVEYSNCPSLKEYFLLEEINGSYQIQEFSFTCEDLR